jgi:hypothetical protein
MTTWRDVQGQGYLSSLWLLDREDDRPLDFHGAFIPAVAEGLILRHTQPGQWIWDPMAGSGTTGLVANKLDRRCFMSDLTPQAPDIYNADAMTADLRAESILVDGSALAPPRTGTYSIGGYSRPVPIEQSCDLNGQFKFDLVILHPPYHKIVKFSDKQSDLSNCFDIGGFLSMWSFVVLNVAKHTKPGGYLAVVIGDMWVTREESQATGDPYGCYPLGFKALDVAMRTLGRYDYQPVLKSIVVKDIKNNQVRAPEYNLWSARYFKWGAVHFAHEYIFSIQKGG